MTTAALLAALDDAAAMATAMLTAAPAAAPAAAMPAVAPGTPPDVRTATPEAVHALLTRLLAAASGAPEVASALADVPAGRALLRFTDAPLALAFAAGEGRLSAEPADVKGAGPKVDASAATWLGLIGGTLKPWLAFTRGLVVCRAGLGELRWLQLVAERLQRSYADARSASPAGH
ncbi:MAG: hypothetical protein Q7S25_02405 [Candidatus Limnocylindria bacterium]|nr:hypothetical protein [Candidatus Limnocylindria bacterium]